MWRIWWKMLENVGNWWMKWWEKWIKWWEHGGTYDGKWWNSDEHPREYDGKSGEIGTSKSWNMWKRTLQQTSKIYGRSHGSPMKTNYTWWMFHMLINWGGNMRPERGTCMEDVGKHIGKHGNWWGSHPQISKPYCTPKTFLVFASLSANGCDRPPTLATLRKRTTEPWRMKRPVSTRWDEPNLNHQQWFCSQMGSNHLNMHTTWKSSCD